MLLERRQGDVFLPGHALHEKGLQRLKGVAPLVSSQAERALLVLVINRGSTADFVPRGDKDACLRGEQFFWHPVLPDSAQPLRRAPRPDSPVVCSGFRFDRSMPWTVVSGTFDPWANVSVETQS